MIALLLVAVVVLVLLNAFFVAAEFALVRSRKAHLQTDADAGKKGAATAVDMMDDLSRYLSAAQVGITLTSLGLGFLGEPAIGPLIENAIGEEVPHWLSTVVSVSLAYLITTSIHITFGEQVPKIYAIQKAETVARCVRAPAADLHEDLLAVHRRAERDLERDPAGARRADRGPARRGRDAGGAARADPGVADRRQARRGRGRDADRRLPPARAAGAPGHDARAGRGHGGHQRGRRDRAAALRVVRPHAARRDRGREPRPRQGHRALQPARAAAAGRRAAGDARRARARGADRPGDQTAGRPAGRPPASAFVAGRRDRRVRPHRRDRDRRGHHRGGRRRDRRRDRSRRAARSDGWPTATGSCAAMSRSPT